MPINPFFVGSLTGAVLVSSLEPSVIATLTDADWLQPIGPLSMVANARAEPTPDRSVSKAEPEWISQLSSNAKALSELRCGWDGPGSIPVSQKLLYRASSYVQSALKDLPSVTPPRLVPGGDGSVQIEWHAKHGELEFDIGPQDEMTIWIRDRRNGAEFEGENQAALALFYRWAPWIASRQRDVSDATAQAQVPIFSIAA
jgi:hypothetical protein